MLHQISRAWARAELFAAAVLAGAVTLLILLNVITRSARNALYWVDEAAIYAMVAMTFLAASAAIQRRETIAITFLPDALSGRAKQAALIFVDVMVLICAAALIWFCWIWFQPLAILRAGFDAAAFQGETFNFVYAERTTTLPMQKFWFWLIVPVFAFGMTLHGLSNLIATLTGHADTNHHAPGIDA